MSVDLKEVINEIRATSKRMDSIEKMFSTQGRGQAEATDILRKALNDGRSGIPATVGFDGSDEAGLLRISNGARQKALGWTPFLQNVAGACMNKGNTDAIEKSLTKMGSKRVEKAALAEGSGATGGYTVPVQFYADLLRLVAEESFVRQRCTVLPMQSRSMLVPALNQSSVPATGTSAFFGGIAASWQPEAATINETEPTFRQIELVARDLVFTTVASNQILQDNAVALDTLLTTLFKEAMSWFIDYYVLRGNGAGQPLGVLNAPSTFAVTRMTASTFKFVDAASMIARLLVSSWQNACWVMHISVLPQLIQMNDSSNGRLVWINQMPAGPASAGGGAAQTLPISLFGIPIFFTEKVPALGTRGDVMLLDLSKQLLGDRLAIQIDVSPHVNFLKNQMVWRIIARWDSQPWLDNVVTMADGAYQMSPAVVLS